MEMYSNRQNNNYISRFRELKISLRASERHETKQIGLRNYSQEQKM